MAKKDKKSKKSDETEEEEEEGGSKKKIIMIVGGLVIVALAYKFVLAAPAEPALAEEEMEEVEIVEGEVVSLEEMVLLLSDEDPRYLRVGLAIVLEEGFAAIDLEPRLPIAADVAVTYFSEQSFEDLRASGAKERVRTELSELMQDAYGEDSGVIRVLLTVFVMQ